MKLYSSGRTAEAIPVFLVEVDAGEASVRYPLGLAHRNGAGVGRDLAKA